MMKGLFSYGLLAIAMCMVSCSSVKMDRKSLAERVDSRDYPSAFMAWYNIDMPEYPVDTEENRIKACAKHDLMWEEPLSQLGEGVDLILGLTWDHKYHGLATEFTKESLSHALENRRRLQELNPNMVCLFEVRWRDAPMSFLPEDSDWWLRDENGNIKKGWLGGWEPFYLLDYKNEGLLDNIARQAKIAVECGVYDGIMLDWSGNLEVIKRIRKAIGKDKLIIVNIHDDIEDGMRYKDYINGAFMELNPIDSLSMPVKGLKLYSKEDVNKRNWSKIEEALQYYEENFLEPQVNCLEVWGNRKDLRRMRATTTLGLTMSDGYVLYGDPNPLPTPDHYHDWYSFYDVNLGKPLAKGQRQTDGSWKREFEGGTVVYNPYGNSDVTVSFDKEMKRVSDNSVACSFTVPQRDGDIFVPVK